MKLKPETIAEISAWFEIGGSLKELSRLLREANVDAYTEDTAPTKGTWVWAAAYTGVIPVQFGSYDTDYKYIKEGVFFPLTDRNNSYDPGRIAAMVKFYTHGR